MRFKDTHMFCASATIVRPRWRACYAFSNRGVCWCVRGGASRARSVCEAANAAAQARAKAAPLPTTHAAAAAALLRRRHVSVLFSRAHTRTPSLKPGFFACAGGAVHASRCACPTVGARVSEHICFFRLSFLHSSHKTNRLPPVPPSLLIMPALGATFAYARRGARRVRRRRCPVTVRRCHCRGFFFEFGKCLSSQPSTWVPCQTIHTTTPIAASTHDGISAHEYRQHFVSVVPPLLPVCTFFARRTSPKADTPAHQTFFALLCFVCGAACCCDGCSCGGCLFLFLARSSARARAHTHTHIRTARRSAHNASAAAASAAARSLAPASS